jgi:hypothetical protein
VNFIQSPSTPRPAGAVAAPLFSTTRRMASSESCAISGSGKRGCACIAALTRRAKRPSIRGPTTRCSDYDTEPIVAFFAT